jgi:hypothetical protein
MTLRLAALLLLPLCAWALSLNPCTFTPADVREIRVNQRDGLRNGTLIGWAGGIGAGLLNIPITCDLPDSECAAIVAVAFVPAAAGLGALSGAVIDALIHKSSTVYRAPGPRALSLSPLLGTGRRGVALILRF